MCPLLLCVLSVLVEVHSQTVPYASFMGTNHSYVDLNLVIWRVGHAQLYQTLCSANRHNDLHGSERC